MTEIKLKFDGNLAENHVLDFYDAARAMVGFQRSLALTTHLVANGEIITQAPSLKEAEILVTTPAPGSWEVVASVVGAAWTLASAKKDSPIGHLLYSVYDYVVASTLGFHVDFNKSLAQSYEEMLSERKITAEKLDSLIEKTQSSIADMHRPIIASKSASSAKLLFFDRSGEKPIGPEFSVMTYDYVTKTTKREEIISHFGNVSSYNINTYKGRAFLPEEERPIAFELEDTAKTNSQIDLVVSSLRHNATERSSLRSGIFLYGRRLESSTGRLKALLVSRVEAPKTIDFNP